MPSSRLFSLQTICYTCTVGVRTETQDCAGLCRSFHELRTREKKDKNISLRILYDLTGTDRHTGYNTRGKVIIIPVYSGTSHMGKFTSIFSIIKLYAETGMIITGGTEMACVLRAALINGEVSKRTVHGYVQNGVCPPVNGGAGPPHENTGGFPSMLVKMRKAYYLRKRIWRALEVFS